MEDMSAANSLLNISKIIVKKYVIPKFVINNFTIKLQELVTDSPINKNKTKCTAKYLKETDQASIYKISEKEID